MNIKKHDYITSTGTFGKMYLQDIEKESISSTLIPLFYMTSSR